MKFVFLTVFIEMCNFTMTFAEEKTINDKDNKILNENQFNFLQFHLFETIFVLLLFSFSVFYVC